ncbi:PHP domain-containing protein [Limnoraphis robusta]|uniref:Histidinol phosphatase n=1 Tax=Limnoraphis robusta CS-951 TaxID=1637645 RepID=A0A0F5YCI5_9CYAN|nr:PHP domain-containing protein [Limnoraphis robusta]KKD36589.1 histidinol phosphatase [Limnoraphis robusta CS-951]
MLELHCHTTYSDGTLTPSELVEAAIQAGVKAIAITDHDTLSGWQEAFAAAKDADIEIVPGVELSTVYNERSLHILGFYPNKNKLYNPLKERLEGRKRRAQKIINKLAELGYPIELPPMGEGIAASRPHIAKALVQAGYVESQKEAFDKWLGDDQSAFIQYEKFSSEEGIKLLLDCDAIPVWAHPYLFRGGEVETVLKELVQAGLMGIEVYHPSHTPEQIQHLEFLCTEYHLLKTGGSDYHGSGGTTLNQFNLSLELLEQIKQKATHFVE